MREAEGRGQPYLFKLRLRRGVKRVLERAMRESDWQEAGAGSQGKWGQVRLLGWSRQRRVVLLRRRLPQTRSIERSDGADPAADKAPQQLGFVELDARREAWEYAVLVTSLEAELLTIAHLYRSRGDAENNFDELKNQWGWGGFTTHDVKRCQFMARTSPSLPIGGTCSSAWPTPISIARRSPAGRCCSKPSAGRPSMPAEPRSSSPARTASTAAPAALFCAFPSSSPACGKLRSS
jgi:hypothetical protein